MSDIKLCQNMSIENMSIDRRKINDTIFGFCKIGKCSGKISSPISSTTSIFIHRRSYHKKESAECDKKAQEAKRMKKEENKAGKQLSVSIELELDLDRNFCNLDRTRSKIKKLISHSSDFKFSIF